MAILEDLSSFIQTNLIEAPATLVKILVQQYFLNGLPRFLTNCEISEEGYLKCRLNEAGKSLLFILFLVGIILFLKWMDKRLGKQVSQQ